MCTSRERFHHTTKATDTESYGSSRLAAAFVHHPAAATVHRPAAAIDHRSAVAVTSGPIIVKPHVVPALTAAVLCSIELTCRCNDTLIMIMLKPFGCVQRCKNISQSMLAPSFVTVHQSSVGRRLRNVALPCAHEYNPATSDLVLLRSSLIIKRGVYSRVSRVRLRRVLEQTKHPSKNVILTRNHEFNSDMCLIADLPC